MAIKPVTIVTISLLVGAVSGYSLSFVKSAASIPTYTDVHISGFAASYGPLRNLKEKGPDEAITVMYTIMNNSLKEMYRLYPDASEHDKQMIYLSFDGYAQYIQNNVLYFQTDPEVDKMAVALIEKHNISLNPDASR